MRQIYRCTYEWDNRHIHIYGHIYIHTHISVDIHIYIQICMYIYIYNHISTHMNETNISLYIWMRKYIYTYMGTHLYMYIGIYVYIYIKMYIYMFKYIGTQMNETNIPLYASRIFATYIYGNIRDAYASRIQYIYLYSRIQYIYLYASRIQYIYLYASRIQMYIFVYAYASRIFPYTNIYIVFATRTNIYIVYIIYIFVDKYTTVRVANKTHVTFSEPARSMRFKTPRRVSVLSFDMYIYIRGVLICIYIYIYTYKETPRRVLRDATRSFQDRWDSKLRVASPCSRRP